MKKSMFIGLLVAVLLFAVLLLAACQPKPTAKPETPGNALSDGTPSFSDTPGNQSGANGDNEAEWQDNWGDQN